MNSLNRADVQLEIAFLIAQGMTQREIAERYNTNQARISRIANRPEIIIFILKERKKLIALTEKSIAKIQKNPQFKKEWQKRIEQMLLNFNTILR